MTTEEQLHPLLKSFKERMKIFHNGEDENISRILESLRPTFLKLLVVKIFLTHGLRN